MISARPLGTVGTDPLIEGTSAKAYNKKQLNIGHGLKNQA
jgi:hypothetical protein